MSRKPAMCDHHRTSKKKTVALALHPDGPDGQEGNRYFVGAEWCSCGEIVRRWREGFYMTPEGPQFFYSERVDWQDHEAVNRFMRRQEAALDAKEKR